VFEAGDQIDVLCIDKFGQKQEFFKWRVQTRWMSEQMYGECLFEAGDQTDAWNTSYKPFTNTAWVPARLCKLQNKWCTRFAAASDKAHQLLAHGRWFSPSTPDSSITKTGR
jgi:hypothetical protein